MRADPRTRRGHYNPRGGYLADIQVAILIPELLLDGQQFICTTNEKMRKYKPRRPVSCPHPLEGRSSSPTIRLILHQNTRVSKAFVGVQDPSRALFARAPVHVSQRSPLLSALPDGNWHVNGCISIRTRGNAGMEVKCVLCRSARGCRFVGFRSLLSRQPRTNLTVKQTN